MQSLNSQLAHLPKHTPSSATSPHPDQHARFQPFAKSFAYLQRPEIFHTISRQNPLVTLTALEQAFPPPSPSPSPVSKSTAQTGPASIHLVEELFFQGQFRAAAIRAAELLTGTTPSSTIHSPASPTSSTSATIAPTDHKTIFTLFYLRLLCLTLIDATALAVKEAAALDDINNERLYIDSETGQHLIPWNARVFFIWIHSRGSPSSVTATPTTPTTPSMALKASSGDPRRAIMDYYDLAYEARRSLQQAVHQREDAEQRLWRSRLLELGFRVANILVDMGDVDGALCHLETMALSPSGQRHWTPRERFRLHLATALLWLRLGQSERALEEITVKMTRDDADGKDYQYVENATVILSGLAHMVDGQYTHALDAFSSLDDDPDNPDEMIQINKAVCQLYSGEICEARQTLEQLVSAGYTSQTLIFNLASIYDLGSDQHRPLKLGLAQQIISLQHQPQKSSSPRPIRVMTGERSAADLKL